MLDLLARCVVSGSTVRSRLNGAEATVIVVVIIVAATLQAAGMPSPEVLYLLGTAGLMSVAVTRLATGAAGRILHGLVRVQSASLFW